MIIIKLILNHHLFKICVFLSTLSNFVLTNKPFLIRMQVSINIISVSISSLFSVNTHFRASILVINIRCHTVNRTELTLATLCARVHESQSLFGSTNTFSISLTRIETVFHCFETSWECVWLVAGHGGGLSKAEEQSCC